MATIAETTQKITEENLKETQDVASNTETLVNLAKEENSSISFPISSTCFDMVPARDIKFSLLISLSLIFFSILSADNFIGVKGFLISCAIFLAISDHAACFSAKIKEVKSSIVTT